jgi:inorganic pyrophosphatase
MENYQSVIFDIDGVLEYQGRVYPEAVETLDALRERGVSLRFLTNSTLKSRLSCAEKLRSKGFTIFPEEVITASSAAAQYLRERKPRSIWVMLEREGLDEFNDLPQDPENPEYVVVGDNRSRFDFDHLNHALRLLVNGAKLVGMQGELIDSSMGQLELNVGSWVGMLERAAGVPAVILGKPSPYVFELALAGLEVEKSRVLVVGDRLQTDVQGARQFGLASALVKAGEFRPADLEGELQPDYIFDSVVEILSLFP